MKLGIYTIEKTLFEGEVKEIIATTTAGEISILPNHVPLISRLVKAPLRFITDAGEQSVAVASGFIEVQPESSVTILVDTAAA